MIQEFLASHDSRVEYWDYKLEGYEGFRDASPNEAHLALVRLQNSGRLLGLLTQNIDGLHSAAGIRDERLVELHGTNRKIRCLDCGAESEPAEVFGRFRETREPPACGDCGGWLKPATISFGQALWESDLSRAREWALQADFVMSLGSTLSVHPAASFPLMAARGGAPYLVVNQGPTDHDDRADYLWGGDLVSLLPELIRRVESLI
jgi:NAD-dependent deacetylase